jgi:hypothetical protein
MTSARPTKIRITSIIDNWSMNRIHALRDRDSAVALRRGEALVAFNRKGTIARIIDCAGAVHTYYAEPKTVFDIQTLSDMVERGFWIELTVGAKARKTAKKLKLAA